MISLVALGAVILAPPARADYATSAQALQQACEALIAPPSPMPGPPPPIPYGWPTDQDRYQQEQWRSQADAAIAQGAAGDNCVKVLREINVQADGSAYCIQTGVTYGQEARIFLAYAYRNPQYLNLGNTTVVVAAMAEAFPCVRPP